MIVEGNITKEVKARLVSGRINYMNDTREIMAQRFYTEGDSDIILSTIYATLEGSTPLESDLQSVLTENPII